MSSFNILTWHTRELNFPIKRSLLLQFIKTYNPHLCVFQETHLVGSRTMPLKKPWVGHHYHSTYLTSARGVSVMVHKSLPFKLLDPALDLEDRYVILHAQIHCLKWIIVGLYLSPPASLALLNRITAKVAEYATDNIVNLVTDMDMDRQTATNSSNQGLSEWAATYGLQDVWKCRNPQSRAYTCHSASHKTFSRTDLAFTGGPVLPRVREIRILPRGISDHFPMLLYLDARQSLRPALAVVQALDLGHDSRYED